MSGRALSTKLFTMMKALSNPEKNSVSYGQKRTSNAKLIKSVKIAHFFFPCYVRTVRTVYLGDFKPAYAVLHLIRKQEQSDVHWWYIVRNFNLVGAYCRFSQLMTNIFLGLIEYELNSLLGASHLIDYISVHIRFNLERCLLNKRHPN